MSQTAWLSRPGMTLTPLLELETLNRIPPTRLSFTPVTSQPWLSRPEAKSLVQTTTPSYSGFWTTNLQRTVCSLSPLQTLWPAANGGPGTRIYCSIHAFRSHLKAGKLTVATREQYRLTAKTEEEKHEKEKDPVPPILNPEDGLTHMNMNGSRNSTHGHSPQERTTREYIPRMGTQEETGHTPTPVLNQNIRITRPSYY